MVLLHFSKEEFLLLGLQLCGFSDRTINRNSDTTNGDRFRDSYYVTPSVCEILFGDIQREDNPSRITKPNPKYLLLALRYLKKYPTKHEMAGFIDASPNTVMEKARLYVHAIHGMKDFKIKWIFDDEETTVCKSNPTNLMYLCN